MTVRELVKKLSTMNPDITVLRYHDYNGQFHEITTVRETREMEPESYAMDTEQYEKSPKIVLIS